MWTGIFCVTTMALGIDAGWRPAEQGGMELVIQVEPQGLETLRAGQPLSGDVPVKDVREFTIRVGTEPLPRKFPSAAPANPSTTTSPPASTKSPAASSGTEGSGPSPAPGAWPPSTLPSHPPQNPLPTPRLSGPGAATSGAAPPSLDRTEEGPPLPRTFTSEPNAKPLAGEHAAFFPSADKTPSGPAAVEQSAPGKSQALRKRRSGLGGRWRQPRSLWPAR